MKQTIEIEVPDGKKAIWKNNKVIFKDIKPQLPKTWEEFCKQNNTNVLPNKQAAEQHLALIQLHQLRDCYRQGWGPTIDKVSFGISRRENGTLYLDRYMHSSLFLSFQSNKIAGEFYNNFRDLIEQAGDLI